MHPEGLGGGGVEDGAGAEEDGGEEGAARGDAECEEVGEGDGGGSVEGGGELAEIHHGFEGEGEFAKEGGRGDDRRGGDGAAGREERDAGAVGHGVQKDGVDVGLDVGVATGVEICVADEGPGDVGGGDDVDLEDGLGVEVVEDQEGEEEEEGGARGGEVLGEFHGGSVKGEWGLFIVHYSLFIFRGGK